MSCTDRAQHLLVDARGGGHHLQGRHAERSSEGSPGSGSCWATCRRLALFWGPEVQLALSAYSAWTQDRQDST